MSGSEETFALQPTALDWARLAMLAVALGLVAYIVYDLHRTRADVVGLHVAEPGPGDVSAVLRSAERATEEGA